MSSDSNVIEKESIFTRQEKVVFRKIAGETFLVPIAGKLADMQRIFVLNQVGEFIWNHLDGKTDISSICTSLIGAFEVDEETAMSDTRNFIGELFKEGLITKSTDTQS